MQQPPGNPKIDGYNLISPKSMAVHGYSRIVLLVKNGTNVQLLPEYMESDLAMIWIRVGRKVKTPLHIGGIYRQHKLPNKGIMTRDELLSTQRERWNRITSQWARAAVDARCICLGDMNLDFSRWNDPDPVLASMTLRTKQVIENKGSKQIITEVTRSWNQQRDSLLDHIWLNCYDRLINHSNSVRSVSDHNVIECRISQSDTKNVVHNVVKRSWKKVNLVQYKQLLSSVDWRPLYLITNVDVANSFLTDKIKNALDIAAPLTRVQYRSNFKHWLSDFTKDTMNQRDKARELARKSKNDIDWNTYKVLRNKCIKLQKTDRNNSEKRDFDMIADNNDTKKLFQKTRENVKLEIWGSPNKVSH